MNNYNEKGGTDVAILVFFLAIGIFIGCYLTQIHYHTTAIENGCAQYNSTTSEFEWVNKNEH